MNKKWLYYVSLSLVAAVLLWLPHVEQTEASSDGYLYWGKVQTAEYAPLHSYTLNWTGDVLDRGGMSLSSLQQTTSSSEADIVINQYGSFGARSVVKLASQELQERTTVYQQGGLNSVTMAQGDIYLITLSSREYAKVRIDQIKTDKVVFSFVVEAEPPAATAMPTPSATLKPKPQPTATTKPGTSAKPESSANVGLGTNVTPAPTTVPSKAPEQSSQQITLTIGQKRADINGNSTQLQTAPVVENGTTLVPLRFIAESIGAEVNWNSSEQKVTLKLQNKVIMLYINSKIATIDGVQATLLTEPIVTSGTTLVPIRFISENFNMKVDYNAAAQRITITGSKGAASDSNGFGSSDGSGDSVEYDYTTYYGDWSLWIEGGAISIYNPATGEYVGHRYSAGADGGTLTINANGTYTLKTHAVTQTGTWRAADDNEVFGYNGGIILEASGGKEAWAMYGTPSGKTALAQDSNGKYTDGSTIWIIQFILDKVK